MAALNPGEQDTSTLRPSSPSHTEAGAHDLSPVVWWPHQHQAWRLHSDETALTALRAWNPAPAKQAGKRCIFSPNAALRTDAPLYVLL